MTLRLRELPCTRHHGHVAAFTLLEMLVVLLCLGILLGLAIPSYQNYMQRAQRAEATRMLLTVAACQERLRTRSGFYDTGSCLEGLDSEHYLLRIEPADDASATEYTVIAEPRLARAQDGCGALSLDQSGTRGITGDAAALAKCWSGR